MHLSRFVLNLSTLCVLVASVLPLRAQSSPRPPLSGPENVTFPSEGHPVRAVMYKPAGKGPFPAIVVIHEWWGLNDWVKQQAQMFSGHGYVTLAVDLYRGQVATDPELAHELMRALPQSRGVQSLTSAVTYLKSQKFVKGDRIGAVGWCMGGGFALQLAIADPSLRAVAINYGALETDPGQLKKIRAAMLGNFGSLDRGITPQDVQTFSSAMKKLGHPVDFKEYPDAGHAFQNPNNKAGYRAADTADADRRMFTFFAKTLKQ
ncbi:MAG TPA: dienelactone hydrolase family protein [Acidobacteriaceae bacterium]|nr:dienelactone hydrolase family protein [Acidobacteriaceae bacterium]